MPALKDYVRLAYSSVRQRKIRSWLTMIGIFIGIAAVVGLISLSQGLQSAILEQFAGLGTDKFIVQPAGGGFGPPGTGVSVYLNEDDEKVISKVKGVKLTVGRLLRIVELEYDDEVRYAYAVSYPDETEKRELANDANDYELTAGRFPNKGNTKEVAVGARVGVDFFDTPVEVRDNVLIQGEQFKVVGILKKTGRPGGDDAFLLPEDAMRNILGVENDFDLIPAQVDPSEDVSIVTERVERELRKHRNVEGGKEDFSIQTPEQILGTLTDILLLVQGVLVGIAAISLVVGGIGIMNTMYTVVLERTREIGILKAVGAPPRQILFLFLVESGMLGLLGGMIGVALGFGFSKAVELISTQIYGTVLIQANASPTLFLGALMFSFTVGALSGALPARQAANLHPVEALRK